MTILKQEDLDRIEAGIKTMIEDLPIETENKLGDLLLPLEERIKTKQEFLELVRLARIGLNFETTISMDSGMVMTADLKMLIKGIK